MVLRDSTSRMQNDLAHCATGLEDAVYARPSQIDSALRIPDEG